MDVVIDDKNAVAGGGLVLPMTLAGRLGLRGLFDDGVDLGGAVGSCQCRVEGDGPDRLGVGRQ
jgi:hypothetical protein